MSLAKKEPSETILSSKNPSLCKNQVKLLSK